MRGLVVGAVVTLGLAACSGVDPGSIADPAQTPTFVEDAGFTFDATLPPATAGDGGAVDAAAGDQGDAGATHAADASPGADAAPPPAMDSAPPTCPAGPPDTKTPPMAIDVSCFTSTFDDEFLAYDISSGPTADGKFPNEKWFNGIEQCCLSPSVAGQGTANYPTVLPDGPKDPVNPYSLLPGGGLQIRLQLIDNDWFSGVMTSVDSQNQGFSQQYGYIEFTAKMPKGTGTWPALWLLSSPPGSAGGELDLLEQYGGNNPPDPGADTSFVITFHDWVHDTAVQQIARNLPDLTAAMHRFGMLWNTNYIAVYFDGAYLWQTPTLDVYRKPYYLLADMGLGSGWDTSQTPSPSDFQIKSIRAYTVPGF